MAYVGKYLNTLAQFPLQNAKMPSSFATLEKQSTIPTIDLKILPSYGLETNFGLLCWVWSKSLTLSIGAAIVFANAPEIPPAKKSLIIFDTSPPC